MVASPVTQAPVPSAPARGTTPAPGDLPAGAGHDPVALARSVLRDQRAITELTLRENLDSLLEMPLTIVQLKVLLAVLANGSSTGHDLAERLHASPATVSGVVDRLVARGLVVRSRHGSDRRVTVLEPTAAGTTMGADIASCVHAQVTAVTERLTPEELYHLARGKAAVRRALEEAADAGTASDAEGAGRS